MTPRTRTSLGYRIVMWAAGTMREHTLGAAAAVLFLVAVGAGASALGLQVEVDTGCLSVYTVTVSTSPTGIESYTFWTAAAGWWWPGHTGFFQSWGPGRWGFVVPLWLPAVGCITVIAGASVANRRRRSSARKGLCLTCGYDLTGITGPCPECGKERKA